MAKILTLAGAYPHQHGENWKLRHLGYNRPEGHPIEIKRGPRGRVNLAKKQVWIEIHNQRLWVVVHITPVRARVRRKSLYPNNVTFRSYRGKIKRTLAETTFRLCLTLWDDWFAEINQSMRKLDRVSAIDPESPWSQLPDSAEKARGFFGLDRNGFRLD